MSETHAETPAGGKAKKDQKMKYYIIGGLALVALLVFVFVRKSNTGSTGTSSTVAGYGATANNSLLTSLLSSGMLGNNGGSNPFSNGLTGPAGAAGAPGAAGPAGPAGPSGTNSNVPVQKSPGASNLMAITGQQATTLLGKTQRPYQWNGTAYVPATSIQAGQQYYAGPLEWSEIIKGTGPFATHGSTTKITGGTPKKTTPPPVVTRK